VAELTFIGAADTVTGSKHLLTRNGRHMLIDCGLFQGTAEVTALNSVPLPVAPKDIESVVITHGHIDHVGYLPKLVHDGFRGTIFATPPTRALMSIVLEDALNLQSHLQKRGLHHEQYIPPAYYNEADVQRVLQLTQTAALATPFDVCGMKAQFQNAAHIIGSSFVQLDMGDRRVVFSGDVGRYNRTLLYDPTAMGPADVLVCEATYGDRVHPPDALGALEATLLQAGERGGPIIIPAFAVERTQEILFSLGSLQASNSQIAALPVYLDSPMAEKVDDLFQQFPDAHKPLPPNNGKTFGAAATVVVTTDDSKRLNTLPGAHIIISSSGMAAGGRVLHHIYHHVSDPKATILFVGYQGAGTLGSVLTSGAKTVRILGDILPVNATVGNITGYSAHADRDEIQRWLQTCTGKPHFYAVHGEPVAAQFLCDTVRSKYQWVADVAHRGVTVTI
jgi:metallo-beta-lactamase family protein